MKRLSLAKGIAAVAVVLSIASCATKVDVVSSGQGYNLAGMEAASFYAERLTEMESVELRYNFCYSLFEGEEYLQCKEETSAAIAKYPNHLRFYYLEVLAEEKLGDTEGYKQALDLALSLNPIDQEILHRELSYYLDNNLEKEAEAIADRILSTYPKDLEAINYKAKNSKFYQYLAQELSPKQNPEESSENPQN